jgi:parallel beta-helix repeat protein
MERKIVAVTILTLLLASVLTVGFNTQPVKADGTIYIRADGSIEPSDASISNAGNINYTFYSNIPDEIVVERNGILLNGSGYTLQGNGIGTGISLSGISGVTITNITIVSFGYGIKLNSSNFMNIGANNITANRYQGIGLENSTSNMIYENNITNNGDGIDFYLSSYNGIFENNIANNVCGIFLNLSAANTISENNIAANDVGIYLYSSLDNRIFRNNIVNNNQIGIRTERASGLLSNTVSENTIAYNFVGVDIQYSLADEFYRNSFINNSQQVSNTAGYNWWDTGYPSGGNSWSDYPGADFYSGPYQNTTGGDGIGDTPYVIDANNNNTDRYPLMNQGPPGYYETSEYLIGSVVVATILLQSNGTESTENWDQSEIQYVDTATNQALDWWRSQTSAPVSFTRDVDPRAPIRRPYVVVSTSYEPINRPSTDAGLWIGEAMTQLGYPGPDYWRQTYDYLYDLRNQDGWMKYNWAFVMFVVDSSNKYSTTYPPNGNFADDQRPFAYFGGPFIVMTSTADGWGPAYLNNTIAHEMGHVFYATDEYTGGTEYSGYLNVTDVEGSRCLMDNLTWSLSTGTRGQVGWRDSDGDGIQDIVDTFPKTVLNPYSPDPTTNSTLTYNGTVRDIPYPNNNPNSALALIGRDITINTIANVQFRIDYGSWISATPDDGFFNDYEESFSFTTPPLAPGNHVIEARGINSVGNAETAFARDDVTVLGFLTINATVGGRTIPTPGTYTESGEVSVQAIPNTDYYFDYWELNGTIVSSASTVTITMDADYVLTAVFSTDPPLTITATSGGTTTPTPRTYVYPNGTVVNVQATPRVYYYFDHWELDGSSVGSTSQIAVTMDANHTLLAVFRNEIQILEGPFYGNGETYWIVLVAGRPVRLISNYN